MTTADKIRSLSDEELAELIDGIVIIALSANSFKDNESVMEWLQQEVDDVTN